ncbi:hypothetical protein H0H81_008270 [Sphagnurus paluster]|uniref:MHC class I antigen n=1 Tax=Sphagnurus paluster TaxID=117069 RepID=A0A9P7FU90_9AGAR|nr:hypothetical protein H0H81_008270 [Sphagnurus paluster]
MRYSDRTITAIGPLLVLASAVTGAALPDPETNSPTSGRLHSLAPGSQLFSVTGQPVVLVMDIFSAGRHNRSASKGNGQFDWKANHMVEEERLGMRAKEEEEIFVAGFSQITEVHADRSQNA